MMYCSKSQDLYMRCKYCRVKYKTLIPSPGPPSVDAIEKKN